MRPQYWLLVVVLCWKLVLRPAHAQDEPIPINLSIEDADSPARVAVITEGICSGPYCNPNTTLINTDLRKKNNFSFFWSTTGNQELSYTLIPIGSTDLYLNVAATKYVDPNGNDVHTGIVTGTEQTVKVKATCNPCKIGPAYLGTRVISPGYTSVEFYVAFNCHKSTSICSGSSVNLPALWLLVAAAATVITFMHRG